MAVLQDHQAVLPADHRAAEAAGRILDNKAGRDHQIGAGDLVPALPAAGEDIGAVAVAGGCHPGRLGDVASDWLDLVPELAMFPLGSPLFPHMPLRLQVFEPRYLKMLAELIEARAVRFGVVLIERGTEVGGGEQRFDVGTVAEVTDLDAQDGLVRLVAHGGSRFRVRDWLADAPYPRAEVVELPDLEWSTDQQAPARTGRTARPPHPGEGQRVRRPPLAVRHRTVGRPGRRGLAARGHRPAHRTRSAQAARLVDHGRVARRRARADQGCGGPATAERTPGQGQRRFLRGLP